MKIQKLRIPFQGSKQLIAEKLLIEMLKYKPKAKYFVDLFGGGGSMSFMALQMGMKVIYNEKDSRLVNFLKFILERIEKEEKSKFGLFPEEFYQFIDREAFHKTKYEDSHFGEFVSICYSFGNSRQKNKSYCFNRDKEELKHLGHDIVVFQCEDSLKKYNEKTNSNFVLSDASTWNARRLDFIGQISKERRNAKEDRLQQLSRLLQQLQQLQQLEQLQKLKQLETFTITNLDFQDVKIETPIEETIVYLDPPYINTVGYGENFNHLELYDYMNKSNYDCFLSEYESPFVSILEIPKRRMYCKQIRNKKKAIEKLFINI